MRNIPVLLILSLLLSSFIDAQERTVGLFFNEEGSFEGYTLFAPMLYDTTYLINNEGLRVHAWGSWHKPGFSAYLAPDGYLYRSIVTGHSQRFDYYGGGFEKVDWEGNVVWHWEHCSEEYRAHHDIEVMPDGNVLVIAWELKSQNDALEAGRDPARLNEDGVWPDYILEVQQTGDSTAEIVWEWHLWDHLVQDHDPTRQNYAVVSEHPELIDINYVKYAGMQDWIHLNSIDYHEGFDQILISSRTFQEIWIIDHSTTTAESRSHSGGRYGKGGDILYRWGNPETYRHGDTTDQVFYNQHDALWIEEGCPGEGNITVFNNGSSYLWRRYSSIDEIEPPVDGDGNYLGGLPWAPEDTEWTFPSSTVDARFSEIFSGAHRLPNGNTLICYGQVGEFVEVTPQGEEVWQYINPVTNTGPIYQGDTFSFPLANIVFKIHRYPADYPGLEGKDLTPGKPVELYRNRINESVPRNELKLGIDRLSLTNTVAITYEMTHPGYVTLTAFDALGRRISTLVAEERASGIHNLYWDGTDDSGRLLSPGVYFFTLTSASESATKRVVFLR